MMTNFVHGRAMSCVFVTLISVLAATTIGCGYSEDEMRAKVREIESLKNQLDAEEARNKQFQKELDEARANIEQLKEQLSAAGVDVANLKNDMEEQARALAEYKRRAAQLEVIKRRFELLKAKLQALSKLGLKVVIRNNKMVILLPGDVLFDSGRETLKKEGEDILRKVAAVVRRDSALSQRDFQVAGHTDSQRYVGVFKDNWGLSLMRAREVLNFLIKPTGSDGGGLSSKHWSASGYGHTDPIAKNESAGGRQSNRRCELVVLPSIEEMLDLESLTK
jgi:chemotaxis protein MotB